MLFTKHDNKKKLINKKNHPMKSKMTFIAKSKLKTIAQEKKKKFKQCNEMQHFSYRSSDPWLYSLVFHLAVVSPALMWEEQMENMITITSQIGRPCLLQFHHINCAFLCRRWTEGNSAKEQTVPSAKPWNQGAHTQK